MKATPEAKRHGKKEGSNNGLTYLHDEIPVLRPAISPDVFEP
jgi:hypothetical protein